MTVTKRSLERIRDDVRRLVDITQTMRFVDDHEIPWSACDIRRFVSRKLVRADDNRVFNFKRAKVRQLNHLVVVARFQDCTWKKKLLRHFLLPLLSQVRWGDNENPLLPLRPPLRDDESRLNCLAQSNFVCEQSTFGER